MIVLNNRVYGLPIYSWLLIALVVVVFVIITFSNSSTTSNSSKSIQPVDLYETSDASVDSTENFENDEPTNSNKVKVYNFNTSWCGWSVRFQPEWEKFENELKSKGDLSHVEAYDVKCDNPANDFLCKEYEVAGFPTVIIETNGKRGVYKGPRDSKNLIETVEQL